MIVLPRVMGHRGAAGLAPENTLAGLRAAKEAGLSWVEFDVMLSGDGVPVLFHDDNLERITGKIGKTVATPYADLAGLEAGAWFGPDFAGEPLPSLEMAITLLLDLGLRPNLEIKPTPGRDRETAAGVLAVIDRCWPGDRPPPLISSFSRKALGVARDRAPHLPRALIAWWRPPDWRRAAARYRCASLHIAGNRLRPRLVTNIKRAGYALAAFTINEPDQARELLAWGVDCIITDRPDVILPALG